jgi:molybdenum cofactor cytidylyltransferase
MTETEGRRVGGVVLAAGESSRFGAANKLLEPVDGVPMVRRVVDRARSSSLDGVVVVVGHEAGAVRAALDGLGVATRENDAYAEGQGTSVRVGVDHARDRGWDAAAFLLGDMPFVRVETIDAVAAAARASGAGIVAPRREGRRGNPVAFDADHFAALSDVSGDRGGRALFDDHEVRFVEVDDPGIHRDVDRRGDLPRDEG